MGLAMNDINPTNEVRPATTLAERAARVRAMLKEHIRTTLEQARDIGNELRAAKEQCIREGKPWLPWLAEAKVNRRTASRHMRISEHWTLVVDYGTFATQGGVEEAIKYMGGADSEEQEVYAHNTRQQTSTNPAAGMAPPPPQAAIRCEDCKRKGRSGLGCEECKKLNQTYGRRSSPPPPDPSEQAATKNPDAREEFGPGADDGEADSAQADYPKKKIFRIDAYAYKQCKAIAEFYGFEVVVKAGSDPTFNHPLIQQAYKKMMQAKWDLFNAAKALSGKEDHDDAGDTGGQGTRPRSR